MNVAVTVTVIFFPDINECQNGNGGCDKNAECRNTIGSRICTCKTGFSGNGTTCSGKYISEAIVPMINKQTILCQYYFMGLDPDLLRC